MTTKPEPPKPAFPQTPGMEVVAQAVNPVPGMTYQEFVAALSLAGYRASGGAASSEHAADLAWSDARALAELSKAESAKGAE